MCVPLRPAVQLSPPPRQASMKYWEEGELRDLCSTVGLQGFTCEREWRFIMLCATKPQQ